MFTMRMSSRWRAPPTKLNFIRPKILCSDLPQRYVNRWHGCEKLLSGHDMGEIAARYGVEKCSMISVKQGIFDWAIDDWGQQ